MTGGRNRARAGVPLRALGRSAIRHPRTAMAVKAALAAALAWIAVRPLGGLADDYPYFAPLGAVVAVSTTVTASARTALQSVTAIVLGGGVALVIDLWLGRSLLTLALVVGTCTALAGWRRLGAMASWVPIAGLFVLILGQANPDAYAVAYASVTAFGAVVGILVNLLLPPLPLDSADRVLDRLRDTMADQLDELAEAFRSERPPSREVLVEHRATVTSVHDEVREAIREASEAQRANWRARRWQRRAQRQYASALTLEQLPLITQDVTAILEHHAGDAETLPWGDPLRERIATTLTCTAEFLRSIDADGADQEVAAHMDDALEDLTEHVRDTRRSSDEDLFGTASLITTFSRLRASVKIREEADAGQPSASAPEP